MRVVGRTGSDELATVFIAETDEGELVEFVESVQPPVPLDKKWVLIVSTLYGCPVRCLFCDAGHYYHGRIPKQGILSQIDCLVKHRFPDGNIRTERMKIQFARMGEPAFNPAVLDVLEDLPRIYDAGVLFPALSTIAPEGSEAFFERLLTIKESLYRGRFQLQFSVHSTDEMERARLVPAEKWNLAKIAEYGEVFHHEGDRKITLNFALAEGVPIDPEILGCYFDPDKFFIKMTPVNPTFQAAKNRVLSQVLPDKQEYEIISRLREHGYEAILCIGELEENLIGSNCGQHVTNYLETQRTLHNAYTYPLQAERRVLFGS